MRVTFYVCGRPKGSNESWADERLTKSGKLSHRIGKSFGIAEFTMCMRRRFKCLGWGLGINSLDPGPGA